MLKRMCPHCGNTDPKFLLDNGEAPSAPDLTLLCVARIEPSAWSFEEKPLPEDHDDAGLVACGMQWDPNEGRAVLSARCAAYEGRA